jgi:hypothetical protein
MALELALSEDDQEKLADAFKDILCNGRLFFEAAEAAEEGNRLQ